MSDYQVAPDDRDLVTSQDLLEEFVALAKTQPEDAGLVLLASLASLADRQRLIGGDTGQSAADLDDSGDAG